MVKTTDANGNPISQQELQRRLAQAKQSRGGRGGRGGRGRGRGGARATVPQQNRQNTLTLIHKIEVKGSSGGHIKLFDDVWGLPHKHLQLIGLRVDCVSPPLRSVAPIEAQVAFKIHQTEAGASDSAGTAKSLTDLLMENHTVSYVRNGPKSLTVPMPPQLNASQEGFTLTYACASSGYEVNVPTTTDPRTQVGVSFSGSVVVVATCHLTVRVVRDSW